MSLLRNIFWKLLAPVRWRLERLEEAQDYLRHRQIVLASPFWDENYYFRHYSQAVLESKLTPIDHFMQIGWKLGYNPNFNFIVTDFQKKYPFVEGHNPLVHYLEIGRFWGCGLVKNAYPADAASISDYWRVRESRTSKKVFYTCITDDYDDLSQIKGYSYINPEWDYVCFTDNESYIRQKRYGIWEIRPLQFSDLDNARNNRYHKILVHKVFPEYEQSVYIDGNINIRTPYLFEQIQLKDSTLIQPIQCCGYCLYKDIDWAMKRECDTEALKKQLEIFRRDGFPENYGLFENNLIYRRHHDPIIVDIMEKWWKWVCDYCRRDQSSLMYELWKHGIAPTENNTINNTRVDVYNFCAFSHAKEHAF